MNQGRGLAGCSAKTFQGRRVSSGVVASELKRYKAPQLGVFGFVNHTHTAATELFDNAVMRDGLTEQMARAPASVEMVGGPQSKVNKSATFEQMSQKSYVGGC